MLSITLSVNPAHSHFSQWMMLFVLRTAGNVYLMRGVNINKTEYIVHQTTLQQNCFHKYVPISSPPVILMTIPWRSKYLITITSFVKCSIILRFIGWIYMSSFITSVVSAWKLSPTLFNLIHPFRVFCQIILEAFVLDRDVAGNWALAHDQNQHITWHGVTIPPGANFWHPWSQAGRVALRGKQACLGMEGDLKVECEQTVLWCHKKPG